jgi:hypothetical protein
MNAKNAKIAKTVLERYSKIFFAAFAVLAVYRGAL